MCSSHFKFVCKQCGGEFDYGWTNEEALAEKDKLFPGVPMEQMTVVCEDCFKILMATWK